MVSVVFIQNYPVLSVVSPTFRPASEFSMVWDRFFPGDLESILSNSPDGSLLLKRVTSKKQLFFSLCDNPVTFDNVKKVNFISVIHKLPNNGHKRKKIIIACCFCIE
ncbi:hypothetical protein Peur_009434 [Populus x canadensis]